MTSTQREKAWRWTESLLQAAKPEGVSTDLLEAVLREVGYRDPYEVINHWTREDRLTVLTGSPGDRDYHARRYTRGGWSSTPSPPPVPTAKPEVEQTRMGKLTKGDYLVRADRIGTVRVTDLVESANGHLVVHFINPDGSTGEYPTWTSTHARILSEPPVDTSPTTRPPRGSTLGGLHVDTRRP
jgi:hypothetical protein